MKMLKIGKLGVVGLLFPIAFILSAILAFIPTLIPIVTSVIILAIIGTIAAIIAISIEERIPLLIAGIAIGVVSAGAFAVFPVIGSYIQAFFTNMIAFVTPIVLITALRVVWKVSK